jgi:CxxC motif-containing protein
MYNSIVGILHSIFVKTPIHIGSIIARNSLVKKIIYVMS